MIESLADFKSATKRIPKILQTFDLTKPESFRLSNSAALNLMARILGYENYNTIKPVFDNISKGNKKMKYIMIDENDTISLDSVVRFHIRDNSVHGTDLSMDEYDRKNRYFIIQLNIGYENDYESLIEFSFKNSNISLKSAQEMQKAVRDFCSNDEPMLDLHKMHSKLSNTDNKSNQGNPNNKDT